MKKVIKYEYKYYYTSLKYVSEKFLWLYQNYTFRSIIQHTSLELSNKLPNQELSVLYGGPTLNYRGHLSLYVLHMLRVNMTRDLAHLQFSDLQGETRPICRTSDLQGERMLICRT